MIPFFFGVTTASPVSPEVSEEANYEESIPLNEAGLSRFLQRVRSSEELRQVLDEGSIEVLHRSLGRLRLGFFGPS